MRHETALPRLGREGFVPAAPEKRVNKRAMLIPKAGHPSDHIPTLMDFSEAICPPERRALREIVETAEVVRDDGHTYLVARVSADALDSLATFETSRARRGGAVWRLLTQPSRSSAQGLGAWTRSVDSRRACHSPRRDRGRSPHCPSVGRL